MICKRCGQAVPEIPHAVIETCRYCGATFRDSREFKDHFMIANEIKDPVKCVEEYLRKGVVEVERELVYVPLWSFAASVTSKSKGREVKSDEIITAPASSAFPLMHHYHIPVRKREPFDIHNIDGKLVDADIDIEQAQKEAGEFLSGHGITVDVEVKNARYLHVPIWLVKYKYGGKKYSALVDGGTGDVFWAQVPKLFSTRTIFAWVISLILLIIAVAVFLG